MNFVYKYWMDFCKKLKENDIYSITAKDVLEGSTKGSYLVLKHDVETDVEKAYNMAKIESKYGHRGSYYIQAYLMKDKNNIELLRKMQEMGHEISYHYDVLDSAKGDMELALSQYRENLELFSNNGFSIKTVCQHGNPVVERVGYTSNRDFFRSEKVRGLYPGVADIMVNFKEEASTDYDYFSDAGRKFNLIFDPLFNDIKNSDEKNIYFENLNGVMEYVKKGNCIISTHPHRWSDSEVLYVIKATVFKIIKSLAKIAMKIPFLKKFMSRYYYLAKKI